MSKKLSRTLLKEIVKECLVELLFEGIGEDEGLMEAVQPKRRQRSLQEAVEEQQVSRKRPVSRKSTPTNPKHQSNPMVDQVQASISGLTNDPVMADIFADTARTTLVEQMNNEGRRAPATVEAATVANTEDISDLFSGAKDWATIAFAGQNTSDT
jgi:hypothetical protein